MASPKVYLQTPRRELFSLPPSEFPFALPPPSHSSSFAAPFKIDEDFYRAALDYKVPFTFAAVYIATVLVLNAFNRSRNWKPWWVGRQKWFTPLVALHNFSLAIYSAITFAAMARAVYMSLPNREEDATPAHYADALCKINGPRGFGDAVTYAASTNTWGTGNVLIKLNDKLPYATDVGRIWNEGLAFWGFVFYLSKFYEVLDTFVLLAKGKRSPTLQTYHHAGAMLSMWAGMRYMSPPIWLFVYLNSLIHTMMYVYFTLATLGFKVPDTIKRTLTTTQILQFIIGVCYASLHLFVRYDAPFTSAYTVVSPIFSAASSVSSAASVASSAISAVINEPSAISSLAAAVASPSVGAFVKRLLLRAAGNEGVAENIRDSSSGLVRGGIQSAHLSASSAASKVSTAVAAITSSAAVTAAPHKFKEETRYRTTLTTVDCIDTSGQAFAIWLNVVYLFPLMVLFGRFFVKSYITRTIHNKPGSRRRSFTESINKASQHVIREGNKFGEEVEKRLSEQVQRDVKAVREGKLDLTSKTGQKNSASVKGRRDVSPAIKSKGGESPAVKGSETSRDNTKKFESPSTSQLLKPESAIVDDSGDEEDVRSDMESSTNNVQGSSPGKKKKKKRSKKAKGSFSEGGGEGDKTEFAKAIKDEAPAKTDPAVKTEPAASES